MYKIQLNRHVYILYFFGRVRVIVTACRNYCICRSLISLCVCSLCNESVLCDEGILCMCVCVLCNVWCVCFFPCIFFKKKLTFTITDVKHAIGLKSDSVCYINLCSIVILKNTRDIPKV
jgi:hypothetical protein